MKQNFIGRKFNRWVVTEELQPRVRFSSNRVLKDRMFLCNCECGNTSIIPYTNLTQGISKSCGCYHKEVVKILMDKMRPSQFGENNPNWKGGITDENVIARNKPRLTKAYRSWRNEILERDGECMKCGSKENLQAHHIENFTADGLSNYPENGICFCKSCHHKFHKIFGFKNNSLEQIDNYLI